MRYDLNAQAGPETWAPELEAPGRAAIRGARQRIARGIECAPDAQRWSTSLAPAPARRDSSRRAASGVSTPPTSSSSTARCTRGCSTWRRRGAERIDVGRPAREATDQDAISYLLAEKAREGKVVARLKMGDPFLFDRGGEEALFLHEQGIPFEVVPGVPVALATAAYAGIPLTYPGGGDTLTIVRGHEAGNGGRVKVNWHAPGEARRHHRLARRTRRAARRGARR